MQEIRIFSGTSVNFLQLEVNEFLQNNPSYKVCDIKYSTSKVLFLSTEYSIVLVLEKK